MELAVFVLKGEVGHALFGNSGSIGWTPDWEASDCRTFIYRRRVDLGMTLSAAPESTVMSLAIFNRLDPTFLAGGCAFFWIFNKGRSPHMSSSLQAGTGSSPVHRPSAFSRKKTAATERPIRCMERIHTTLMRSVMSRRQHDHIVA